MKLPRAPLEDWLRDYYFTAAIDISSSGVQPYSFAEIRPMLGVEAADFDNLDFRDSPTCGDPRLRAAIAQRWGVDDPSHVMAANGSTEALFAVLMTLLRPSDEVIVVEPAYHSLISIATAIGCRVVRWPLRFEDGFRPDLDELDGLLSPATRMLVINFPHNPTGVTLDDNIAEKVIAAAASVGAYLLWDAAFTELTHVDPVAVGVPGNYYDRTIVSGTLSKAYGLPGLRVGWCIAPPDVVTACASVRDYTTLALSPMVELVALRAVQNADALLQRRLTQARHNLGLLDEWMSAHKDRVSWVRPEAGVVAFPRLLDVPAVDDFCHRLMREHGVLLVPGTCFGRPGHVRIGFGGATHELVQGLSALSQLISDVG